MQVVVVVLKLRVDAQTSETGHGGHARAAALAVKHGWVSARERHLIFVRLIEVDVGDVENILQLERDVLTGWDNFQIRRRSGSAHVRLRIRGIRET